MATGWPLNCTHTPRTSLSNTHIQHIPSTVPVTVNCCCSFIAKNARDPVRYVIQTDDGFIQSENEPGMHRLRTDKQHSEMLNYVPLEYSDSGQSHGQSKRTKRDNNHMKTDDAPEVSAGKEQCAHTHTPPNEGRIFNLHCPHIEHP